MIEQARDAAAERIAVGGGTVAVELARELSRLD